jgi:hypothetical protein
MDDVEITLRRVLIDPLQPPKAAHGFFWVVSGGQFLLEVGFVDLAEMHRAVTAKRAGSNSEPVDLLVSDRFILNKHALRQLADVVRKMLTEAESIDRDDAG